MGLKGYIAIGVGLAIAGALGGCAGMVEAYGSVLGSEAREEIAEQTLFNCSLINDPAQQNACKGSANIAIRACKDGENVATEMFYVDKDCYRKAHNESVKSLAAYCDQQSSPEKEACLKRVPPEKQITPKEPQEKPKSFSITN